MATLYHRFTEQVSNAPSRCAIVEGTTATSYQELAERAAAASTAILSVASKSRSVVAVFCEHGSTSVTALLAGLAAQRIVCCIPIDLGLNETRRILRHSQAELVATDGHLRAKAEASASIGQTIVDVASLEASRPRTTLYRDRWRRAKTTDPAIIIYSSGSSGQPKGVLHRHTSLVANADHHIRTLGLHAEQTELHIAKLSTISGLTDLFRTLFSGGCIVPLDIRQKSLDDTAAALRAHAPHRIHLVPTVFRRLANQPDSNQTFASLQLLHLGGEPVTRYDLELFRNVCPDGSRLLNNFGCSEVPTARQSLFTKETTTANARLPLTQEVPGKQIEILSEDGIALIPNNEPVVGQIAIRSEFTAMGYWRDSQQTSRFFSPSPSDVQTQTFYTGDIGSLTSDGALTHLGRSDRQVKILGRKVDLAELESALQTHPSIKEAAVTTADTRQGLRLIAHIVRDTQQTPPSHETLAEWLAARLDDRMMPHAWHEHDELPTLPSGKIDYSSLNENVSNLRDEEVAARVATDTMKSLAEIWEEVLNAEAKDKIAPRPRDSFFALGGDSLSAASLSKKIADRFGRNLEIATLFRWQTLERMARLLDGNDVVLQQFEYLEFDPHRSGLPTLGCVGDHRPLGLIRSHFDDRMNLTSLLLDGIQTSRFRGLDVAALADAYCNEWFQAELPAPHVLVGFSYGGLVAVALAHEFVKRGADAARLLLLEPSTPGQPMKRRRKPIKRSVFSPMPPLGQDPLKPFAECLSITNRNVLDFRPTTWRGEVAIFGGKKYVERAQQCWPVYTPDATFHRLETNDDHLQTISPQLAEAWLDRLEQWANNDA